MAIFRRRRRLEEEVTKAVHRELRARAVLEARGQAIDAFTSKQTALSAAGHILAALRDLDAALGILADGLPATSPARAEIQALDDPLNPPSTWLSPSAEI